MTHWRKNVDPNFLSGEDLKYNLIKDMPDGVAVEISGFRESEGFDKGRKAKVKVIELRFKNLKGDALSKGVIPAKWTSEFMIQQGVISPDVEDWVGQKLVIYAKADSRFGHVVRFRKYKNPNAKAKLIPDTPNWNKAVEWLRKPDNTMEGILKKYSMNKADQKKLEETCKKE